MKSHTLLPRSLHRPILAGLLALVGLAATSVPALADFPVGPSPKTVVNAAIPVPMWKLGAPAPELHVITLDAKHVKLADYKGKLVVLEFGSMTEPAFRLAAPSVNWLARKWAGQVQFIVVYQQESHPAGGSDALAINTAAGYAVPKQQSMRQRIADAQLAAHKLPLKLTLLTIDDWRNQTALAYGSLANMTFLIDARGRLIAAWPWLTPWQLNSAVTATLAGKPVPAAATGPQFSRSTAPPLALDYMSIPPGSPQTLAAALDRAQVTPSQLKQVLPAVMNFSTALLKTRQQLLRRRQSRGEPGPSDRNDLHSSPKQLRQAALELTASLHRHLTPRQYNTVLAAINRGRLRRIFEPDSSN
ncbi:MAG: deiodinase-like protein [Phycisphaerae bacterium]